MGEQKLRQKKQIECDISILEINESVVPLEHLLGKSVFLRIRLRYRHGIKKIP